MVFEPTQMVEAKQGTYIGGIGSLMIPDGADGQGQWIVLSGYLQRTGDEAKEAWEDGDREDGMEMSNGY